MKLELHVLFDPLAAHRAGRRPRLVHRIDVPRQLLLCRRRHLAKGALVRIALAVHVLVGQFHVDHVGLIAAGNSIGAVKAAEAEEGGSVRGGGLLDGIGEWGPVKGVNVPGDLHER